MKPATVLLFALVIALVTSGCTPSEKAPGARTGEPVPPAPSPASVPVLPPAPPGPANPPSAGPPAPPPRVFDESILRGREFLLEAASGPAVALRDEVIGELGGTGDQRKAIQSLVDGARSGALDEALLSPRWASYLQAWAKKAKADLGAGPVRVGAPLVQEGSVTVPVRVVGTETDWTGWVVLEDHNGWLVSDVQLTNQPSPAGPFDPEGARQLISSPNRR